MLARLRELNCQTLGKKRTHLRGRFCFHILKNLTQNNKKTIIPVILELQSRLTTGYFPPSKFPSKNVQKTEESAFWFLDFFKQKKFYIDKRFSAKNLLTLHIWKNAWKLNAETNTWLPKTCWREKPKDTKSRIFENVPFPKKNRDPECSLIPWGRTQWKLLELPEQLPIKQMFEENYNNK